MIPLGDYLQTLRTPMILLYWFGLQVLAAIPQLASASTAASSGVAVVAHLGGFVTGAALAKVFANGRLVALHGGAHPRGPR